MPYVKHATYQVIDHPFFNASYPPRTRAPVSGIYRCVCGFEIAAQAETNLPERDEDARHERDEWSCSGQVKWQPVAFAIQVVRS